MTLTTGRLEAFSDGIVAIAATLLVLEIKVPEAGADVWHSLQHQFPSLAAYVVAFLTILIFWVNHHSLFHVVQRVDRALLFLNGLLLLGISFISYPTAVLGRALESGEYARSAAVFEAIVLGLTSLAFTAIWLRLRAHPELLEESARSGIDASVRRTLVGPAVYSIALLAALVDGRAALAIFAAIAAYFAVLPRHLRQGRLGGADEPV